MINILGGVLRFRESEKQYTKKERKKLRKQLRADLRSSVVQFDKILERAT